MAARLLACFAAASLPGAEALRHGGASALPGGAAVKQELSNLGDVQYYGEISVGGQDVAGILDTGSFELVLFSKNCDSCGIAGKYDEKKSATYEAGKTTQEHAYGSGACMASDGFDTVAVNGLTAKHLPLWLATQCQMPVLQMASFNAIVGIGPPGEPVLSAEHQLKQLQQQKEAYEHTTEGVPKELEKAIESVTEQLKAAQQKPSLLESFGVSTFSECLGRQPGSPGWLIWNDDTRSGAAGVQRIPVAGQITWGVSAKAMALTSSSGSYTEVVACKEGCGAIVDTGTSLFAMPTDLYQSVFHSVNIYMNTRLPADASPDCSDLSHFPDLVMEVGGQQLSFPPSSYIGSYVGQMNKEAERFVRLTGLARSGCQLLIMDLGASQATQMGPMIILGMPFFREYYTTFDLGSGGPETRSLFVSKAGDSCEPAATGIVSGHSERGAHAYTPRKVDTSKLRVPEGLKRLNGRL